MPTMPSTAPRHGGLPDGGGLLGRLSGLRGKLMLAITAVLSGTLIAAAVALTSYAHFRSTLLVITGEKLPAVTGAMGVAQQAERLVALAPSLAAAESADEKASVSARVADAKKELESRLAQLGHAGLSDAGLTDVRQAAGALLGILGRLDDAVAQRLQLGARRGEMLPRVIEATDAVQSVLAPWNSMHQSATESAQETFQDETAGEKELREAAKQFVSAEHDHQPVARISGTVMDMRNMLLDAATTSDLHRLDVAQSRAKLLIGSTTEAAELLPEKTRDALKTPFDTLNGLMVEPENLIDTRVQELGILRQSRDLLTDSHALSGQLSATVGRLVAGQQGEIATAADKTFTLIGNSRLVQIGVGIASVVVSILIVWLYVGKVVIARLLALKQSMQRIAKGDLAADVAVGGRDEITEMAAALLVFRDTAKEVEAARADAEAERVRASESRRRARQELTARLDETVKSIVGTVSAAAGRLNEIASTMAQTAEQTSREAESASDACGRAVQNVDGAAAGAQELSASIAEIARSIAESASIAGKAVEDARNTDATVRSLQDGAARIGEVVGLIHEIANQTNLLALNATIEAARAGDAGRGFAVVASEVKQLAGQTASATEQITQQIEAMQGTTEAAVAAIRHICTTIGTIDQITAAVAAAVEEQGAATAEIARNVTEAAAGTAQVSGTIDRVTKAADETGQSARFVLASAEETASQAEALRTEVDRFIREVSAA